MKVELCALESSSSFSALLSSNRDCSSHARRRIVPRRSTAEPKLGGRLDAISRRMREASLQPLPDVVIPICKGPSECVERSVKVQRSGASVTLTGIRSCLHKLDI